MISILTTQYDAKLEPLKEAVESGNSDFLRRWLEEGQPICNPESKRESLLSVAVKSRQFSMLELLPSHPVALRPGCPWCGSPVRRQTR